MRTTSKNQKKWFIASAIGMLMVMLALIRCIGECFRLNSTLEVSPGFELLEPFLLGAFICSIAILAMITLSFFKKEKIILVLAATTIAALVYIKSIYL